MVGLRAAYESRLRQRYGEIKTIFSPDAPLPLRDTFSELTIELEPSIRRDFNVLRWKYPDSFPVGGPSLGPLLSKSTHVVIIGAGGSGKSHLLQHLLLEAIEEGARLPVYLQLRRIAEQDRGPSRLSSEYLMDALWAAAVRDGLAMDRGTFDQFAGWGQLMFFMDGLDEVSQQDAGPTAQAIGDLRDRYSDCPMIVTSRPFRAALAWDVFRVLRIAPMSREQALNMIDRAAPDGDRKKDFTTFLADAGGARMTGLAGNPLLAQLMFMTYDDWKSDASPHVFYRQALRALFHDHDAKKPNFRRTTCTGHPLDELETALEGIAIQLALAGVSTFGLAEVEQAIGATSGLDPLQARGGVDSLLEDLEKAVGIVTKEAGRYEFIHPNLVDYLAARFVGKQDPERFREFVSAFAYRLWRPDIVRLVRDVEPVSYERHFLLPELEQLLETIDGLGGGGRGLLRACGLRVEVLDDTRMALTWGNLGRRIAAVAAMHIPQARLIGTGRFGSDWIGAAPESRPPPATMLRWTRDEAAPRAEGPGARYCVTLIEELEWKAAQGVVAIRDFAYRHTRQTPTSPLEVGPLLSRQSDTPVRR